MEENLGNILRKARESTGKTVDDAVYLAKIPRSVVEALEAEDFGFFTSTLYARSFLKLYGRYVGADVEPWLSDLEPTTMIDGEDVDSFIDISDPITETAPRERKSSTSKNTSGSGAWAALWMLLITAGVVWGGLKGYEYFENKLSPTDPKKETADSQSNDAGDALKPAPAQSADAEKEANEENAVTETVAEPPRRAIIVQENP